MAHARIVARLRERGHRLDQIREAGRQGRLAYGYIESLLGDERAKWSVNDAADETGLEGALIERFWASIGLPSSALEDLTDEDVDALRYVSSVLAAGFPLVAFLQLCRVYGQSLAQIADAEVRLFHLYVHEPLMREGVPGLEMAEEMQGLASDLLPIASPLIDSCTGASCSTSWRRTWSATWRRSWKRTRSGRGAREGRDSVRRPGGLHALHRGGGRGRGAVVGGAVRGGRYPHAARGRARGEDDRGRGDGPWHRRGCLGGLGRRLHRVWSRSARSRASASTSAARFTATATTSAARSTSPRRGGARPGRRGPRDRLGGGRRCPAAPHLALRGDRQREAEGLRRAARSSAGRPPGTNERAAARGGAGQRAGARRRAAPGAAVGRRRLGLPARRGAAPWRESVRPARELRTSARVRARTRSSWRALCERLGVPLHCGEARAADRGATSRNGRARRGTRWPIRSPTATTPPLHTASGPGGNHSLPARRLPPARGRCSGWRRAAAGWCARCWT